VPVSVASAGTVGAESSSSARYNEGVVVAANAPSRKRNSNKKQEDASQPFLYKWQEASNPSTILVPSLNVKVIGAVEDEASEEEETLDTSVVLEPSPSTRAVLNNNSRRTKEESPSAEKIASGDNSNISSKYQRPLSHYGEIEKISTIRDDVVGQTRTSGEPITTFVRIEATKTISSTATSTPTAQMGLKSSSNKHTSNDTKKKNDGIDNKKKVEDKNTGTEDPSIAINTETKITETANTRIGVLSTSVTRNNEKCQGKKEDKNNDSVPLPVVQQSTNIIDNSVKKRVTIDDTKKEEGKSAPTARTSMATDFNNIDELLMTKEAVRCKITFASSMPKFLDASEKFNGKNNEMTRCPSSGQWKGYFENVIPGKKSGRSKTHQPSQIQKVDEIFYLFLNATPSSSKESMTTSNDDNNCSSSINKERWNDDHETDNHPSVDLFAFQTATKYHIPKIINSKIASTSLRGQTSAYTDARLGALFSPQNDNAEAKKIISLVQVRGCGENEFGTFEIMGYLDLNTMVMEIQRQYVVTEVHAASPPASSRRRRSSPNFDTIDEGPRPHSTRKRNPTWKRASYDPEDERRRKRVRPLVGHKQTHGSPMSIDSTTGNTIAAIADSNSTTFNPTSSIPFATTSNQSQLSSTGDPPEKSESNTLSTSIPMSTMSSGSISLSANIGAAGRGSKSRLVLPTQSKSMVGSACSTSLGISGGRRRSSSGGSGGGLRTKRRSSTIGKSATGLASTKSGSTHIRLPSVGDPKKGRWRAAHFLYYQRDDPEHRAQQQQQQQLQSGNNANPSGNNGTTTNANKTIIPKPKYVIYEGEMVDSKREGRGISLYTDGTLYEGEWKRNKEHGYGKLMSTDRKKIIYDGEWERGRMQGTGTYYYGTSDPLQPGSRYVGEFKENLRNGIGRYFLPNGSVYDGQWRDGVMNGLGIFTWPDNSMYDGVWKDGKRNGQGLLKKADGFVYDGQWVNNTMEGRGSAIYPNGQRYEGSFSNGRREGRGTIVFTNGAVYEGRFRDDAVDGQGTMKMSRTMIVPREDKSSSDHTVKKEMKGDGDGDDERQEESRKEDFMIPISFQSDMTRILTKTGFM